MKYFLFCLLFILSDIAFCQDSKRNYAAIDTRAKSIGYLPLEQLTKKLTSSYSNDEDKTRAIFMWIAYHIRYDDAEFEKSDSLRFDWYKYGDVADKAKFDSLWNLEFANFALKNKRAICGEYAALFKAMCDIASLKCVVINGNAKWSSEVGKPIKKDHSWNAVFLNGKWQLMDVTWAVDEPIKKHGKVIQSINTFYYCTPPELLINNHYADSLRWTLLPNPISRTQYQNAIYFNYESANKIKVESAIPKIGFLKKKVGDSISFEIVTNTKCQSIHLSINDSLLINYEPIPILNKDFKFDSISRKQKEKVDDIFEYLEKTPVNSKQTMHVGTDNKLVSEKVNYFKSEGNKVSFKYYIKKKGDFLIWVTMDFENIMAYRLLVD